jgi:hypothetical protein
MGNGQFVPGADGGAPGGYPSLPSIDAASPSLPSIDMATLDLQPFAGTLINNVYLTWYGFDDNKCSDDESGCATIAFPKSKFPVRHQIATEGTGAFDDPITFATSAANSGSPAELAPGTIIYVPEVRKYFIMEDQCSQCDQEWLSQHAYHVDLWMGPSSASNSDALSACEAKLVRGKAHAGTGSIILDPPADLTVDLTPLFTNGTCTAHTY